MESLKTKLPSDARIQVGTDAWVRVQYLRPGYARVKWPVPNSRFLLHAHDVAVGQRRRLGSLNVYVTVRDLTPTTVELTLEAPADVELSWDDKPPRKAKVAFREVPLPAPARGHLYLHSLPGRYEPLAEFATSVVAHRITRVICLVEGAEAAKKSPNYAAALEAESPWRTRQFPIPDFGVPSDVAAFWDLAAATGEHLRYGESILVHCAGGIGRTGLFATAVLMRMGVELAQAEATVRAAGSGAETPAQKALLRAPIEHL